MTLSRMPVMLAAALMAAGPQAAPAKGKTAQEALETYRATVAGCLHRCPQLLTVNLASPVPAIMEGIKRILDPHR
jgi:hypothetical protein